MDKDLQSIQEAREAVAKAKKALEIIENFSQEEVDRLVARMAEAGYRASRQLAQIACEESGFGQVEGKTAKNQFSTRILYEYLKNLKTAGIIKVDQRQKTFEIATPMGVVAAIIPITNPTSTALFKILIAVKARCAIVLSPHPRGVRCIGATAERLMQAAASAGAPDDLISCLRISTLAGTQELMRHRDTAVILATGGPGLVHTAYSSGKPAIGVGPGNCPAYIHASAHLPHAIRCLVSSQGFDWGTICASEQSVVLDRPIEAEALAEFRRQRAHLCSLDEVKRLEALMPAEGGINPDLVGQSPATIARLAGFSVPGDCTILLTRQSGVGREYPLSREKLCPILALYTEDTVPEASARCLELLRYGGMGHTLAIHARDRGVIETLALALPASRIMINAPSSQGACGYGVGLVPSMTLGCGSAGGNITSDNISPLHLINIRRVAYGLDHCLPGIPTPSVPLPEIPQEQPRYRSNPFADLPKQNHPYFVGPHNNPRI